MVGMACAPPLIRDYFVGPKLLLDTNLNQDSYLPTRNLEISPMSPKTVRSQMTTAMTTTAFKIDLMEPAIGMYELTSQRSTPTTIKTTTTWIKGMIYSSLCLEFGPAMKKQPISISSKLLRTYFSSLTPKADPITDGKAMNLSLISV
jgi:hypothetical protein